MTHKQLLERPSSKINGSVYDMRCSPAPEVPDGGGEGGPDESSGHHAGQEDGPLQGDAVEVSEAAGRAEVARPQHHAVGLLRLGLPADATGTGHGHGRGRTKHSQTETRKLTYLGCRNPQLPIHKPQAMCPGGATRLSSAFVGVSRL